MRALLNTNVTYGCSPAKLAKTLGKPESEGAVLYDAFWEANPALKQLRDNVDRFWKGQGQKKWVPAIDGRRLMTRKAHSVLNTLFQSAGAIAMDYACVIMDYWLGGIQFDEGGCPCYQYKGCDVRRVLYVHDEVSYECDEEVAEEVGQMIVKAIELAGKKLKFKLPLAGESKTGATWAETH